MGKGRRQGAAGSGGEEWRSIEALRQVLEGAGATSASRMRPIVGIGDDAAVLREPGGTTLVWTIDASVEGVHFRREWLSLRDIGWRATHAAVSDVAAMGARPIAALCHSVVPSGCGLSALRQIGAGQAEAARELSCPVIGGNLSSGPQLELSTTVLGEVAPGRLALRRAGARPKDEIWLVGDVGWAAAGLRALQAGLPLRRGLKDCARAWRRPRALVAEGQKLQGRATACIDVSDGLTGDGSHLARASGVALVFAEEKLTVIAQGLVGPARRLGVDPIELCLEGGEDYALLATGPQARRPRCARVLGNVEAGAGVWLAARGGRRRLQGGFQHFR